jgi:pterin-4a-carbinolamine dehydratase
LDMLQSDVSGVLAGHAHRFSPVPGGVGPLSAPMLFMNVVKAALTNMKSMGSVLKSWESRPSAIIKTYHFRTYEESIVFLQKVEEMSKVMDHHANAKITHHCVNGVDVELELFTYEAKRLTSKDIDAAKAIDSLTEEEAINMNVFKYDLKEESIATHPAFPRGSSKLLHVNEYGHVAFYDNFETEFPSLAAGSHLVFNDSRVLDARLFVRRPSGDKIEMMILDLGGINIKSPCKDVELHVMLRTENLSVGDTLELVGGCTAVVKGIKW